MPRNSEEMGGPLFNEKFWEALYRRAHRIQHLPITELPASDGLVDDELESDAPVFDAEFVEGVYRRAMRIRNLPVTELPPSDVVDGDDEEVEPSRLRLRTQPFSLGVGDSALSPGAASIGSPAQGWGDVDPQSANQAGDGRSGVRPRLQRRLTEFEPAPRLLLLKAGGGAGEDARAAFGELISLLQGRLARLAYRYVSPAYVPDLLQETWLSAWEHRSTYRGEAHPLTWLCTIMAHVAHRDRDLRPTVDSGRTAEDLLAVGSVTEDLNDVSSVADIEAILVAASIDRALAKLDPLEAEVIRRRHLAQQTWARIAHDMGFPSPHYAQRAYNGAMRRVKALGKERWRSEADAPSSEERARQTGRKWAAREDD